MAAVISLPVAIAWCLAQTTIVVAGFYVFIPKHVRKLDRDDPHHIKHRLVAFLLSAVLCFLGTYYLLAYDIHSIILCSGATFESTLSPLFSFVCLFAGHWSQYFLLPSPYNQVLTFSVNEEFWVNFRNIVFSPFPEEFIFRSLMVSVLVAAKAPALFLQLGTPLFFSVAHLHLGVMSYLQDPSLGVKIVVLRTLFQMTYTWLFGALMTTLLLRTHNLAVLILVHSFCNMCGFPSVEFATNKRLSISLRATIAMIYGGGIFLYWNW